MNIDSGTHFASKEVFLNPPRELRDPPRVVLDNKGLERIVYPGIDSFNIIDESTSSLSIRIDAMKEAGFDKQCLLVANGTIPEPLLSLETSTYLQKSWNDVVAKVMRENDCFIGIAQVPTRDVDLAIEEARRATRDLGFRGIQIHGSWGSKNIESFEWWPFLEEIERLDVP